VHPGVGMVEPDPLAEIPVDPGVDETDGTRGCSGTGPRRRGSDTGRVSRRAPGAHRRHFRTPSTRGMMGS
jgi:hypothetical protein